MQQRLRLNRNGRAQWLMPFSPSELEGLVAAMLDLAGQSGVYVELALLDDAAMESLHTASLGRAGPTNVLSFPAGDGPEAEDGPLRRLGSLALSADTLHRECFLYGQDLSGHAVRLLAHGLAHLLGHEHGPAMDGLTRAMEQAGARALADFMN